MAHRHKVQALKHGGGVEPHLPPVKEQSEGKVKAESRERKKGGRVERAAGGAVVGAKAATRMDRPGRKMGGRVGSDRAPLSSAAHATAAPHHEQH